MIQANINHLKTKGSQMATKKTKVEKTLESKSYKEALMWDGEIEGVEIGKTIGKSVAKVGDKKVATPFEKLNVYIVGDILEDKDDATALNGLDLFWEKQHELAETLAEDSTPEVYDTQAKKNTKRDFGEFRATSKTEFLARALTTYSGIQNNAGNWPLHDDAKKPAGTKREATFETLYKEVATILMPLNNVEKQTKLWDDLLNNEKFTTIISESLTPKDPEDERQILIADILEKVNS